MKLIFESWRKYLNEVIGADENPDLSQDAKAFKTAKKPIPLDFRYAEEGEVIYTRESPAPKGVTVPPGGAAVMTGTKGEVWPIPLKPDDPAKSFGNTYDILEPGKAAKKNIPVFAKEMQEPFQVKVSWSADLLQGEAGDFLVQYGPGDYGVVGAEIFKETYK
jgi:hypothetical protein